MVENFIDKKHNSIIKVFLPFELGQIVKIKNIDCQYKRYVEAFSLFKISNHLTEHDGEMMLYVDENEIKNNNWVIVDFAMHSFSTDILVLVKNSNNKYLVMSPSGLKILDKSLLNIKKNVFYRIN